MATKYQIQIKAEYLKKISTFRVGSFYAVVTDKENGNELGRTEIIESSRTCRWCRIIYMNGDDSTLCRFQVAVWEHTKEKSVAEATFELTEVLQSPGSRQTEELGPTELQVQVTPSVQGPNAKSKATLQFRALDIKNVESGLLGLGRSDPFLEIAKKITDLDSGIVTWSCVHRTNHIMDNLNPFWERFDITLEDLCYGDTQWPLQLSVWDWQSNGRHRMIGHFQTTFDEIRERKSNNGNADRTNAYRFIDEDKPGKTKGLLVVIEGQVST